MTISNSQAARLRYLIQQHVTAQVALSWKGGEPPESWPEIEAEAEKCLARLNNYINYLKDRDDDSK